MNGSLKKVAIIGGARIPFCRSMTKYSNFGNKEMMTAALKELVKKYNLNGKTLGGVAVGAVVKSSRDFGIARECAIDAGISYETPAIDVQTVVTVSGDTYNCFIYTAQAKSLLCNNSLIINIIAFLGFPNPLCSQCHNSFLSLIRIVKNRNCFINVN